MKHVFVTFLIFMLSTHLCSQEREPKILTELYEKSIYFERKKEWDSAIHYSKILLTKSKYLNNNFYRLKAFNKLAKYCRINNLPFNAVFYYNKSKELNLILGDSINAINKLRFIASIQKRLGDYNSSEITAIDALRLSEKLTDSITTQLKIALYNHLGLVTGDQFNYNDAKNWFDKALILSKDSTEILAIKNNLALIHLKNKEFDEAISKFNDLLDNKYLKTRSKARIQDNLAYAKSKLQYPEAEDELLKALKIRKEINDFSGQFASYIHLTEYHLYKKDTFNAASYAKLAYSVGDTLKSPANKIEALSYLIQLEENPKKVAKEYQRLNDSIIKARQQAKNQFAKIKYETEENREKILVLENETARQELILQKRKTQNIVYAALGILTVILSMFFYFYLKAKHHKEKLREVYNTEKRLSQRIHDELANDVYQVMTLLDTEQKQLDPETLDKLEDIYERTRNISRENSSIATGTNYAAELKQMLSRYRTNVTNIIINGLNPDLWKNVPAYKKVELYRALQELMTNMRKHSKATLVAISFKKEAKTIQINYSDNGIGIKNGNNLIPNGLVNVENRINAIKGLTTFDKTSERGLKIHLSFPV